MSNFLVRPFLVLAALLAAPGSSTGAAALAQSGSGRSACFVLEPAAAFVLRKGDVARITAAVRQALGRPIRRIEMPALGERAPPGVVQVVTLRRGNCANGDGDILWLRKGARGWRVVKNLGRETWGTGA